MSKKTFDKLDTGTLRHLFLMHISLNYHDIFVNSLSEYHTPKLLFFTNFVAQSGGCILYTMNNIFGKLLYNRFTKLLLTLNHFFSTQSLCIVLVQNL